MDRKDKLILEELQNIAILTNTNRIKLQELETNLSSKFKSLSEEIKQINNSQQLTEVKNKALQVLADESLEYEVEDIIINQFLELTRPKGGQNNFLTFLKMCRSVVMCK